MALALLVIACGCAARPGTERSDRKSAVARLRAANEFRVEGRAVRFTTYAWLNLQPGRRGGEADRHWSPLHLYLILSPADSQSIHRRVQVEAVFLIDGDSSFTEFRTSTRLAPGEFASLRWPPQSIAYQLSGGPWWAMQSDSVDVVIRVRVEGSNNSQLVRAPRVALARAG